MSTKFYNPDGVEVWAAQYGSQELTLSCPVKEILVEGNRGSMKSITALMDFAKGIGQGWGSHYTGICFRNEYKHLGDLIAKSKLFFKAVFPDAIFKKSPSELKWVFAGGEELLFRHGKTLADYEAFHGHEYPWQFFDELTNFPDLQFYDAMASCCRSPVKGIYKRRLSATNPHGQAHTLVKKRFIDPAPPNTVINDEYGQRVRIHASFTENEFIFVNDPEYIEMLLNIKDPVMYQAWVKGNWNIPSGGMFQHIWFYDKHVIDLDKVVIPKHWKITRSMDYGSAKPFAVCWFATSTGETIKWYNGTKYLPKGTKILLSTWYGCEKNKPNTGLKLTNTQIADGIIKHEKEMGYKNVKAGAADSAMFADALGTGKSMMDVYKAKGVKFNPSKKGSGSRVGRCALMADMLHASLDENMEEKGIFFGSHNIDAISQIPDLPRDAKNPEDVDTESEDHIYDTIAYEIYNDEMSGGFVSV